MSPVLVLTGGLGFGVARAEPPSPARECADAAQGAEIEVCLRLAAETPDAVPEITSALVAHLDRAEAPDRNLLDALLLLSSAHPTDGTTALGKLGDPRAIPVLVRLGVSKDRDLSGPAVRALAGYPQATPLLSAWLVDHRLDTALRAAVADALGASTDPTATDALQDSLRRRLPPTLRAAVARNLAANHRYSSETVPPSTDGAPWLSVGAGLGLGYAMGAAGYLGPGDVIQEGDNALVPSVALWQVGAVTGGVAGSSLGWLWGRAWPKEAGEASLIASTTTAGIAAGGLVGLGSRPPGDTELRRPALGGILGEGLGVATAFVVAPRYGGSANDPVEALAFGSLVAGGAAAAGVFASDDPRPPEIAAGLVLVAGLGVGHVLAPRTQLLRSAPLALTGGVAGVVAGFAAPTGGRDRSTLPVATGLLGVAVGGAVSGWVCPPGAADDSGEEVKHRLCPPQDVLLDAFAAGAIGGAVMGGVGMLAAPKSPDVARGLGLGGGAAGFGIGALFSTLDKDPIDERDVAVVLASAAWATWDVVAVGALTGSSRGRSAGAVLVAAGTAAGVTTSLNLELDVPVPHTLSATSIGLWGGYVGAAIGGLANLSDPLVLALPGSNLGLLGGSLLVSPRVGASPLLIAIADSGGAMGASLGAIGAGLAGGKPRSVVGASLGGAVFGLALGAVLGEHWTHNTPRRDVALRLDLPPTLVEPMLLPGGGGAVVEVTGW